jgi:uncharacterized protein (TIGR02611 family)
MATEQQTREPPKLVQKLQDRREAYADKGRVYRSLWVAAGVTVVAAGIAMVVFPGPAVVVIPIGLAMLSLEFCWAQRLLDRALEGGLDAKDAVKNASTKQKALGATGVALGIAAVAAVGISIWA